MGYVRLAKPPVKIRSIMSCDWVVASREDK